jgi:4-hydroxy-tetrahydrodipicolinate synthase
MTLTTKQQPPLAGVMAALVTPLDESRCLDVVAVRRMVDHILTHPVQGICPAGSTGEGALLPRPLRAELTAVVVDAAAPGTWVIPGIIATTLVAAREDLAAYADAGASAVLVGVPYYYSLGDEAIYQWYRELADSSTLPLVLYNIPSMTKLTISPDVVARLASHEQIIGMKDSSRDVVYFQQIREVTAGARFALLTGSDALLLASIHLGGDGLIGAGVNVIPALITQLWTAMSEGDFSAARTLQQRVARIVSVCAAAGVPVGFKAALSLLGLCQPFPAVPLQSLRPQVADRLAAELRQLGVVLAHGVI